MAVPKNKEELVLAIEDSYAKLKKELNSIPIEMTGKKELEGHAKGTQMSLNDLVSYLVGWSELVLGWCEKKEKGLEVDFPEKGYKWNELGKLAQKFYDDYKFHDYQSLLSRLEKRVGEILKLVNEAENWDLYERAWYGKWTKGKMIQLNTSSPYKNARKRIRKWKKLKKI